MKQKILIVTWMGGGNTRPVLSMASDLVAMGHTVHILSNPDMRARSEKTGAVFHPFRRIPPHNPGSPETDIIRAFEGCSVGEINRLIADRFVLGLARPIALDTADAIEAARADIVASDYTMPGAMIAAERAGCCLVLTADGEYPIPIPQEPQYASRYAYLFARILAEGLSASGPLCALRANWGMQAIETPHDLIGRAARVLVMTYPVLSGGREPPGAVYVGPQFEPPATLPPPADRKTVFGTFSTIATPEQDRFVTALARASANDQRHMLLACGASQPVSNAFVRAERFVDFPAVLPDVRLALSHSGNGTVTFLLAYGIAQIAVPFIQDQHETAGRLVDLGLAQHLRKTAEPHQISDVLRACLADHDMADRAFELAIDLKAAHIPAYAAREVLKLHAPVGT